MKHLTLYGLWDSGMVCNIYKKGKGREGKGRAGQGRAGVGWGGGATCSENLGRLWVRDEGLGFGFRENPKSPKTPLRHNKPHAQPLKPTIEAQINRIAFVFSSLT